MEFRLLTVHVKDMEKSLEFYSRILGLGIVSQRAGGGGAQLAFLGREGQPQLELVYSPADSELQYAGFSVGISVDDTDTAVSLLESKGYPVVQQVSPSPHVKITRIKDPNGITVSLIEESH